MFVDSRSLFFEILIICVCILKYRYFVFVDSWRFLQNTDILCCSSLEIFFEIPTLFVCRFAEQWHVE